MNSFVGQGVAQAAFEHQVFERGDVHVARIELEAVAANLLGPVHGGVGIQEGLEILAVGG